jgi:hypothetical protein
VGTSLTCITAELEPRWKYSEQRTSIKVAIATAVVTNQGFSFWGLQNQCSSITGVVSGVLCVYSAISTAVTAAGSLYRGYEGAGYIWRTLTSEQGFFKRDTIVSADVLDELSTLFGGQVTHLGHWSYAPPARNGSLGKRDVPSLRHVFGLSGNGMDIHFAYLGNITNKHTFRMGFGSGTGSLNSTSPSNSRIRARQFNDQWFQNGGLDINLVENPDNLNYDQGGLNTNADYDWINLQVSCLMSDQMDTVGQFFQIYDEYHQNTLAAGAVAPFTTPGGSSAIFKMGDPHGGLKVDPLCTDPNQK